MAPQEEKYRSGEKPDLSHLKEIARKRESKTVDTRVLIFFSVLGANL